MVKLNGHIKASTLMESLVAMVITVVCFSIATMIFVNIVNGDKQRIELKALLLLDQEVELLKHEKNFLDDEKEVNGYLIKKTIERYPETENVYHISLVVKDKTGRVIAKQNQLMPIE